MPLDLARSADLSAYRDGDDDFLLIQAEALVRDYCGWHIAPSRTETLTLDGIDYGTIFLPSKYVTAVSTLTVDGTVASASNYTWDQSGRIYLYSSSSSNRQIVVALTHGYTQPPAVVTAQIVDIVMRAKAASGLGGMSHLRVGQVDRSVAVGADGQPQNTVALTAANRAALRSYALPGFA